MLRRAHTETLVQVPSKGGSGRRQAQGRELGPAGSLDWLPGGVVTSLPFWKQGRSRGR